MNKEQQISGCYANIQESTTDEPRTSQSDWEVNEKNEKRLQELLKDFKGDWNYNALILECMKNKDFECYNGHGDYNAKGEKLKICDVVVPYVTIINPTCLSPCVITAIDSEMVYTMSFQHDKESNGFSPTFRNFYND